MNLSDLLEHSIPVDVDVTGLALDSRFIHPGEVFVALQGTQQNGQDYVPAAVERGASAILTDVELSADPGVPVIVRADLRKQLSALAARFYGFPGRALSITGVTGTNGKSSVTDLLQQAWRALGWESAAMGTLGVYGATQWRRPGMTTSDPIQVQAELAMLRNAGVTHVAMEVSSHGLDQFRVEAVPFDVAVFTNLTRDHLDYHGSMEAYAQAKQRLFTDLAPGHRILNAATPAAMALVDDSAVSYGAGGQVRIEHATAQSAGWTFDLCFGDERVASQTGLLGAFNLDNLAAVAAVLLHQGVALAQVAKVLPKLKTVRGRMQWVSTSPAVLVDYAHTPDGLESALSAARAHCSGQLWVVFGAGGDRDRGKRPEMGRVAEQLADRIVVTSDNPRSEEPNQIIADVQSGMQRATEVEVDRVAAIHLALSEMADEDTLIIAGKGHETEQVLADRVIQHDDAKVAADFLAEGLC